LPISSTDIRQQFIDFFKEKDHQFIRSSSVIPSDDPTLLFTNAGMNQFKTYFVGSQTPDAKRVVNSQKCIRVSGKHNDLEEVGVDDYHHTFFEMLGNWSFGDYYKKEAISWAWELLTEVWKLDKNRLWITIFKDDDEAGLLWGKHTDIEPNRILKFGHKDNFWEMGETGPCGPCTEIHYYTGNDPENQSSDGVNALAEYREIWNLVFIQYNRDEDGKLHDLPDKHVDTGAGFERLVAIVNGKLSNYETDLFLPILKKIIKISGKGLDFENGIPHRVIADHIRMLVFSITDGAMPANEGRGYVLRRVLRRAARFGRMLEIREPFIYKLTNSVCQIMGDAFPELIDKEKHIENVINAEEKSFNETLDRGLEVYSKITHSLVSGNMISGKDVFKLYDTYGFPVDLTELMAREDNLSIDNEGFRNSMMEQKERSKSIGSFLHNADNINWQVINDEKPTEFVGYENLISTSNIIKYYHNDDHCGIVLDKTPFYAESGGQVGDTGQLLTDGFTFLVSDIQKRDDQFVHIGHITAGSIEKVDNLQAEINETHRSAIRRNHTATHIMHQALKNILGDHVQQAGSMVGEKILRFDLTHYEQITSDQINAIEALVNNIILSNSKVNTEIKSYKKAQEEGAVSLFGEKYGDSVRVVDVPGFSKELCGGTHVQRTGDIGGFKITSESALASGIRRITAVTGESIVKLLSDQETLIQNFQDKLKSSKELLVDRLDTLLEEKKNIEKENIKLQKLNQSNQINELLTSAIEIGTNKLIVQKLDSTGDLQEMGDQFRDKMKQGGILLVGTVQNQKPMVMCAVTDDLISTVKAVEIVKELGIIMGGGGGGKSHFATAGGKEINSLDRALQKGKKMITELFH